MSDNSKKEDANNLAGAASKSDSKEPKTEEYDPDDGVCRNIVWGTNNHLFYGAKYGKKVCNRNIFLSFDHSKYSVIAYACTIDEYYFYSQVVLITQALPDLHLHLLL